MAKQVFEYVVVSVDEKGELTGFHGGATLAIGESAEGLRDSIMWELAALGDKTLTPANVKVLVRPFV